MTIANNNTKKLLRLLVVDDDPVDRELVKQAFVDVADHVSVDVCESAAVALQFLNQKGAHRDKPRPDACIFDINMPKMSGLELLKQVKADPETRKVLVAMMSSSDDPKDIEASYNLHASCYIQKPQDYRELKEAVSTMVAFWADVVSFPSGAKRLKV